MYEVGDVIFYGNTGVCQIQDITVPNIAGVDKSQLYYVLRPFFQSETIYSPVNTKVFMRPVISVQEAHRLIDMIPTIQAQVVCDSKARQCAEHYQSMIHTHDCEDLIELTMSIYAKKQQMEQQRKKFGAVAEWFMKRAEELLFGELSIVLGISKDDIPEYIAARVRLIQDQQKEKSL